MLRVFGDLRANAPFNEFYLEVRLYLVYDANKNFLFVAGKSSLAFSPVLFGVSISLRWIIRGCWKQLSLY